MPSFARKERQTSDQFHVATDAGPVAVALRRDSRARNYTLRVHSAKGSPILTMPARGTLREARAFLDRHAGWLLNEMGKLPEPKPIVDGALVPFRGKPHRVRHLPDTRGTVTAVVTGDGPMLLVAGRVEHVRRRVVDFMKQEARRDLERAVLRHAMILGVRVKAVRLRDQTSRWGSCTATGHLSFSWRLVMAPPFVLDYLAAHEVAHLHEMNHSPRFWHLVESICPQMDDARRWLNKAGAELHAIGLAD